MSILGTHTRCPVSVVFITATNDEGPREQRGSLARRLSAGSVVGVSPGFWPWPCVRRLEFRPPSLNSIGAIAPAPLGAKPRPPGETHRQRRDILAHALGAVRTASQQQSAQTIPAVHPARMSLG